MKIGLIVLAMFALGFCAGGDTINYSTAVKTLSDGEPFWANQHWHSATDTIARVVNGRLGNVNIATTANIDPLKLDTNKRARFSKVISDSLIGTADSAKGAHHLSGGTVAATTISSTRDSTGVGVIKDSLKVNRIKSSGGPIGRSTVIENGSILLKNISGSTKEALEIFQSGKYANFAFTDNLGDDKIFYSIDTLRKRQDFACDTTIFTGVTLSSASIVGADTIKASDVTNYSWGDTSTIVGFSSFSLRIIECKRQGSLLYVYFRIAGTSNSTDLTFTLPYKVETALSGALNRLDNGVEGFDAYVYSQGNLVTAYINGSNVWTSSGTKSVSGTIVFLIRNIP